uniref:Reverse transcriptase domain-containing protein n=1 Tax=Chromera velia CCMP2878 TaxID=1169474 RepID=A0A0G4HD98_9ALVE|eukprot:Cvel_6425.t1-p1 / transcript=Cvel_6425.t1 / gene=Cvel_6425 / organism=Chromera_velia_CCMP2878 / gene_product=hypothetical protein / transcript_product=hypothetical protein / location=Cvel_scaffold314:59801-60337(+) / protein_length=179 / sequence_SO=supercontig / SO=protein_coding / is_pseudo=false
MALLKPGKSLALLGGWRGVHLVVADVKWGDMIMRMKVEKEARQTPWHFAYKKKAGTYDAIFLLLFVITRMEVLSVAFVDFTRAFDEVRLEKLKEKLRKAGVEEGLIRWVEASLEKVRARVKGTSIWYPEDKGLKQGGPSGPSLYSVYIHDLPEEVGKRRGQRRQTDRQKPKVPAGENGR